MTAGKRVHALSDSAYPIAPHSKPLNGKWYRTNSISAQLPIAITSHLPGSTLLYRPSHQPKRAVNDASVTTRGMAAMTPSFEIHHISPPKKLSP
jgi:hypothetical protein